MECCFVHRLQENTNTRNLDVCVQGGSDPWSPASLSLIAPAGPRSAVFAYADHRYDIGKHQHPGALSAPPDDLVTYAR